MRSLKSILSVCALTLAAASANANESEVMAFGGKPIRAKAVHHGRMVQAKKCRTPLLAKPPDVRSTISSS